MRVLEYCGGPGAETDMHYHPDVVAYPLNAGKFKFTLSDGNSMELELQAGEAAFMAGHSHSTENTGDTEAHVILVELK